MTAEAIARLRETLNRAVGEARDAGHSTKGITVRLVVSDDLRALLDVTVELVNALQLAARSHLELGGCESADDECVTCAVLAKAGRR